MKIMGIDFGEARTGVCVSDITGLIAGEAFVINERDTGRLLGAIALEAKSRNVSEIVLGNPKNMNATEGERARLCAEFAESLRTETGLPVVLWDERRTTVDAHRILRESGKREIKHKKIVDAVAASIILQNYLDYKNNA
ncbi:MAG: Holliday junction resolvase RuvX [Bacillota bacterium]|nr:Holliday junction resolvase RuvX [Bacillota bacterium]